MNPLANPLAKGGLRTLLSPTPAPTPSPSPFFGRLFLLPTDIRAERAMKEKR